MVLSQAALSGGSALSTALERLRKALADHYLVERELGHGGMATVYLAEDLKHRRQVAIKVIHSELAAAIGHGRFLREIEIAAQLNHPHILPLFDSGTADGLLYYVMPYVEGESLCERLQRETQLSVEAALTLAGEIADALAYAHAQGILHRDVKPENILLLGGHAVLADFGIARASHGAGATSLTQTGVTLGTVAYMSPEQAAGNAHLDGRSDQYSLGCVLYEMLAGQPPFMGPTTEAVVRQLISASPPDVRILRPNVPAAVAEMLARLLAKVPADRYSDAGHFVEALAELRALPTRALAHESARNAWHPRIGMRLPRAGVLAAMAVALVAIGIFVSRQWRFPTGSSPILALAVLPLENLSHDPDQEYFADGMTEALISNLAKIGALRVISRTSVMRFKGTRKSVPEIARDLGVDAVVAGSVTRQGDQVRISAQLVQARPERQLWGQEYEREMKDILSLQAGVAAAIAREIHVQVTPEERMRLGKARPVNPAAHDAYLRGRFLLNKLDGSLFKKALEEFQSAVEADPTYAPAWAGMADAYYYLSSMFVPSREAMPKSRAAAEKALEIDPDLAEAYTSLATVQANYGWEWAAAEQSFRRSIELKPSYAPAHFFYGILLTEVGRTAEAEAEIRRAQELDPLSFYIAVGAGSVPYMAGRYEEAARHYRKMLEQQPNDAPSHWMLGRSYEAMGDTERSIGEYRAAVSVGGGSYALTQLCQGYAAAGRKTEANALLHQLLDLSQSTQVSPYNIGLVYAELGAWDKAFLWFERAYADRDEELGYLKVEPRLASVRSDPRYRDLLRRIRLGS
jgi:serine/threonine-protein kinase